MPVNKNVQQPVNGTVGTTDTALIVKAVDETGAVIGGGDTVTTATLANVNDTNTSTTLFSSNSSAKGRIVFNDSTATLYVKFGTTASTSSFTYKVLPGGYLEFAQPVYTGRVDGIWDADASGAARTTELS